MNSPRMTDEEVLHKLLPLIEEVTAVPQSSISMESGLMQDLGAGSLDLLDLSFLIEDTFGVTLEPDEFTRQAKKRLGEGVYERDGLLTEEALEELRKALPEVPAERLQPPLAAIALPRVLNVAVFVHLIQRKLAEAEGKADHA